MTPKTKEQYKADIKRKLAQIVAAQWDDVFSEYRDHPNIFTAEEAAEIVKCSDAVREVRAELEGATLVTYREVDLPEESAPPFCQKCFNPDGACVCSCDCSDCSYN